MPSTSAGRCARAPGKGLWTGCGARRVGGGWGGGWAHAHVSAAAAAAPARSQGNHPHAPVPHPTPGRPPPSVAPTQSSLLSDFNLLYVPVRLSGRSWRRGRPLYSKPARCTGRPRSQPLTRNKAWLRTSSENETLTSPAHRMTIRLPRGPSVSRARHHGMARRAPKTATRCSLIALQPCPVVCWSDLRSRARRQGSRSTVRVPRSISLVLPATCASMACA